MYTQPIRWEYPYAFIETRTAPDNLGAALDFDFFLLPVSTSSPSDSSSSEAAARDACDGRPRFFAPFLDFARGSEASESDDYGKGNKVNRCIEMREGGERTALARGCKTIIVCQGINSRISTRQRTISD